MSRRNQTGGNTEPLPFVRKWGAAAEEDNGNGDGNVTALFPPKLEKTEPIDTSYGSSETEKVLKSPPNSSSTSRRKRSRSPDSRRRSSRSRSSERKRRHRSHRSRSRDRGSRRSSSREHTKKRSRRDSSGSRSISQAKDEAAGDVSSTFGTPFNSVTAAAAAGDPRNPMSAVAEAVARANAIIRMKQQADEKMKAGAAVANQILAKPDVKSEPAFEGETKEEARERRRKSRWSTTKSFVPGMPTILPSDIDESQRQCYLLHMEIEETTRKLRSGDYLQAAEGERSPSPEPIYDANGKRLNTREIRKRQELEQRRHEKIQALLKLNPEYKPPADYRAPNVRLHDKVWIPQEDHPEINFVGLLIGPRGNTLKQLEQETGAKIIIRGKGSVKEGKLGRREGPLPGENEPLHAYITATDPVIIKKGCEKIKEIINAALMIPDGQNELRKLQLRELAVLNGTLRPEDLLGGTRCSNCGSDQHKSWECPDAPNVTASIVCTACGGSGHIARDCRNPRPGYQFDGAGMDDEYSALMAELGEKPPSGGYGGINNTTPIMTPGGKPNRFRMPGGSPIIRVNLTKPQPMRPTEGSYWGGPEAPPPFFGVPQPPYGNGGYGMQPQGWPPMQGGAGGPWPPYQPQSQHQTRPMPVPPPPQGSSLSIFPPPPPPPPPPPKSSNGEGRSSSSSGGLNSFLAPPPPPS